MNNRLPPIRRGGIGGNAQLPGIADLLRIQNEYEQQQQQHVFGMLRILTKLIKGQSVRRTLLSPNDQDYVPNTRTWKLTFPFNFLPPVALSTGHFLQSLLLPLIESQRVVIRMAYSRSVFQLVRGRNLNPVSYQRQNFTYQEFESANTRMLLEEMVDRFTNSNDDFQWENLIITVINGGRLEDIRGAGGRRVSGENAAPLTVTAEGVLKIPGNAQDLCGFIAIVCHLKRYEEVLIPEMKELYDNVVNRFCKCTLYSNWLRTMKNGRKLVDTANAFKSWLEIGNHSNPTSMFALLRHGDAFVRMFPKFRIVVVDENCKVMGDMCGSLFFETHVETESKMHEYCISLMFKDNHFDLIYQLTAFWRPRYKRSNKWYYCNVCLKAYHYIANQHEVDHEHKCDIVRCDYCKKPFEELKDLEKHQVVNHKINCSKCERLFLGEECMHYHARRCTNDLQKTRCDKCYLYVLNIEQHQCTTRPGKPCLFCGDVVPNYDDHDCKPFIAKLKMPEESLSADKIWAFDIECFTEQRDGKDVHVPNLIVCKKLTEDHLYKFDTVEEFMEFLTQFDQSVMFFAHNFGGYDGRVLFKYFVRHPLLRMISAIPNGTKFMAYTFTNGQHYLTDKGIQQDVVIKFRDSYRHMSQSLRSLPKTYGLDPAMFAKGFYPHTFNRPENRFYKGPLPPRNEFHPEEMRDDEKEEFEKWYSQQLIDQQQYMQETGQDDYYDHYKEFVKYCESDVVVLAEALLVYMKEYMEQCNGLNPLEKVTIASHCMSHYLTNHMEENTIPQLKPLEFKFAKDAFFGGRTHPCSLLVENSKIGYVDVNSLYPAVMVNCPLPVGSLKYVEFNRRLEKEELMNLHGIFEIDVNPTKYLHHPIFPKRDPETFTNSYPLQRMERVKRTSIEIHKALENGYDVEFVYGALLTNVGTDLFKSYIYEAQTAKLLASGEPPEFQTEEGKQKFIEEYKQEMGVDLSGMVFERNAGKRATAKLTNNSLWGKFGENTTRVKMHKYELVKDGEVQESEAREYNQLLNDIFDGKQLFCQNFTYTDDDDYQVTYMFVREVNDGYNQNLKDCTNVMLCAFVTANARMVLWDALNFLGDRVLYCDTDSVIYLLSDNEEENIKSSSKLGEWKDECEGEYITDFVSIAPKSYAYKMSNGERVVKCKGVTLNYENSKVVTFETLKDLVVGTRNKLTTRHLMFDCKKQNEFEINTIYREKATMLNKNMLKGELMMKDNEWNLNIPRDYMLFPIGFEDFIDEVQRLYPQRRRHVGINELVN